MEYSERMEQALSELCSQCSSKCNQEECLTGFSKSCIDSYKKGNGPRIPDGVSKLPIFDSKLYEEDEAANIIAIACKWCHNCEEEHSEDCVVSLCRRAMELGIVGDEVIYKGSNLVYLKDLEKVSPEFSSLVVEKFSKL